MKTSKSPRRVLQVAYEVSQDALPAYSHRFSPKKFTQHQFFALLVLKEFLRCDYRKIEQALKDCRELCQVIGLEEVPHFTAIQKASKRLLLLDKVRHLLKATLARARKKSSWASG